MRAEPGWIGHYMLECLGCEGQGGGISVYHRNARKLVFYEISGRQPGQCRAAFHADAAHPRHPRRQAKQGGTCAGSGFQHKLVRFSFHHGGHKHRLKPASMARTELPVA